MQVEKRKIFEGKYSINKDTAGVDIRGHTGKRLKSGKLRIHRKASGGWNTAGSDIADCAFMASKGREAGEKMEARTSSVCKALLFWLKLSCV